MAALSEINERWKTIGHPYAEGEGPYHAHCPVCESDLESQRNLHAAMNDAIVHKIRCPALES